MLKLNPGKALLILVLSSLFVWSGTSLSAEPNNKIIKMATTTSTENSGLLKYLLPKFTQATGYDVHVIAVGTGKALRMGQDGDVDVVLVHARPAEDRFVAEGYGEKRFGVMYNDFVIIGPPNDPAKVAEAKSAVDAMQRIAKDKATFISRGDDSGTNKKEMRIWKAANIKPEGKWYRAAGQGMGKVIQMANELNAYTLSDRGTWIAFSNKTDLNIVYQGDKVLFNPYGIIAVNPKRYPDANHTGAQALINWITSNDGQKLIANYKIAGFQLFTPSATKTAKAAK